MEAPSVRKWLPMADRIPLVTIPVFLAGLALSRWTPLRIVTPWWIALVIGAVLGVVGLWLLLPVWRRPVDTSLRAAAGFLIAYFGLAVLTNTWWPILLILPALAGVVRWRAVRIQTGHRQP